MKRSKTISKHAHANQAWRRRCMNASWNIFFLRNNSSPSVSSPATLRTWPLGGKLREGTREDRRVERNPIVRSRLLHSLISRSFSVSHVGEAAIKTNKLISSEGKANGKEIIAILSVYAQFVLRKVTQLIVVFKLSDWMQRNRVAEQTNVIE